MKASRNRRGRSARPVAVPESLEARALMATVTYSVAGGSPGAVQGTVDSFRSALGVLNPNQAGSFLMGRREVNWDGVADNRSAPNNLPADFFNTVSPRGLLLATTGTGFQVSAGPNSNPPGAAPRFGNLNPNYPAEFQTFSSPRLFTALGSTTTDVTFVVPGGSASAAVSGFGVVFTDVDTLGDATIELFDGNNASLGVFQAEAASGGLSFLGVTSDNPGGITRVRIVSGTAPLGANDISDGGTDDVVAMDDFIYGEPQAQTGTTLSFGVNAAGTGLLRFFATTPGQVEATLPITGLTTGDTIVGSDFRPANGLLYVLARTGTGGGRVYLLNPTNGVASVVSTLVADPSSTFTGLDGTQFDVDFNPVVNRMRVLSNTGQNLRVNVDTGATITDGTINGVTIDASTAFGAAYANNFPGVSTTTLYVIDAGTDALYIQSPPNNGTLTSVGALGVDATAIQGFDIRAGATTGLATLVVGGTPGLYSINLATGAATLVGATTAPFTSLALQPATPSTATVSRIDTTTNTLVRTSTSTPNVVISSTAITGLTAGDTIVGTDFRPANGLLYALARAADGTGRLYTIDVNTAVATLAATLAADPSSTFTGLTGTQYDVDFNPTVDRLRVLSNTGQNLRVNPATGATITDGAINGVTIDAETAFGVGYINSFVGAASTTLYVIDAGSDTLYIQNPPNNGTLTAVGALGLDATAIQGFDIKPGSNLAVASLTVGGQSGLYAINLTTGAATLLGADNAGTTFGTLAFNSTTVSFSSTTYTATEGQGTATITLVRTGDLSGPLTVSVATSAGTAVPGQDYTETATTATFADGATTATFTVPILNNPQISLGAPKTVNLILVAPSGGPTLGANAILQIADSQPRTVSIDDGSVLEAAGSVTLTIRLDAVATQPIVVSYATIDGTATSGVDYVGIPLATPATVTIPAGQGTITVTIPLIGEAAGQPDKTFSVVLLGATDGAGTTNALLGKAQGAVTIVDPAPTPPPPGPLAVTGRLAPESDSGVSNSDNITNVTLPIYIGTATPGAIISISVKGPGSSPAVTIGTGVADASGSYRIPTNVPLSTAVYTVTADARLDTQTASATLAPLTIDTIAPVVTNVRLVPAKGQIVVTYLDPQTGMAQVGLLDGANYLVTRTYPQPTGRVFITALTTPAQPSGVNPAGTPQPVTLTLNRGRKIGREHFGFLIRSEGITDVAGNALDGEFFGKFPSGNGQAGSNFAAALLTTGTQVFPPQPVGSFAFPDTPAGFQGLVDGVFKPQSKAQATKAEAKARLALKAQKPAAPKRVAAATLGHFRLQAARAGQA